MNVCQRGNTALMVAACNGHTDVITYLLDNGADVNAVNQVSVREGGCGRGREGVCVCEFVCVYSCM